MKTYRKFINEAYVKRVAEYKFKKLLGNIDDYLPVVKTLGTKEEQQKIKKIIKRAKASKTVSKKDMTWVAETVQKYVQGNNMKDFRKFIIDAKKQKTAVFAFGRMNPPTIGHSKLLEKVVSVAKKEGGTPMVYPSKTEDKKKNPLSFKTKVKVLKDVFGNIINTDKSIKTPFDVLESLNDNYERVIFVVGSDRVSEFKRNMSKYVDSDLENIKDFTVVSAGERDPDADGVSGMSGSKMREFVIKDKFSKFKEGLMTNNAKLAKAVFVEIGKKLK